MNDVPEIQHPTVPVTPNNIINLPWRVGRSVPRNVYAQVEELPSQKDTPIAMFHSEVMAKHVVKAHNLWLSIQREQGK